MRYLQLSEARHAFVRYPDQATAHIVNTIDHRTRCGCPVTSGMIQQHSRQHPAVRVCPKCARETAHTIIEREASDVRD